MNIHPIFVHFPIALFTIFALLEIFTFFVKKYDLDTAKGLIVVLGTTISFITLQTGEIAEHIVLPLNHNIRDLVEKHSSYATLSTYIFLAIALVYVFKYFKTTSLWTNPKVPKFAAVIVEFYLKYLGNKWFLIVASILGLVTITITGALGGAIVYGPEIDPFVKFIYSLFF